MYDEYRRRNLLVCSSIGATAAARTALERLATMKRPPKWIVEAFKSVQERTEPLTPDLARWRNEAPDAPQYKPWPI